MDLFKINIKLFAESDTFAPAEFVPIFHRWIQNQSLANHLLIDVADYAHVHAGPGIVLIASEANIHMDLGENRLGLLYTRKMPTPSAMTFLDHLRGVLTATFKAAVLLEEDPELTGRLAFRTDQISIRLNDRLNAPNTLQTLQAVKPDIESLARELYGPIPTTVEHDNATPLSLFEVRIKAGESPGLARLLERIISPVTV